MTPYQFILKAARKVYTRVFPVKYPSVDKILDVDEASQQIYDLLASPAPCMIARWGSVELNAVVNYIGVTNKKHSVKEFIKGKQPQWWWNEKGLYELTNNAGFFPSDIDSVSRFAKLYLEDAKQIDLLGSWRPEEQFVDSCYPDAKKVTLVYLEPYLSNNPWSKILEGKRVLVVHPFSEEIESQYKNYRTELFYDKRVLPEFHLETLKAVQSIGGNSAFSSWFEALDWMKSEMDKHEYDIALIGCGAYGLPLAAHAKRTGHKAVHLGGALQLLFGIKGNRWEMNNYADLWGLPHDTYLKLLDNPAWIRPGQNNRPKNADKVEGACYW